MYVCECRQDAQCNECYKQICDKCIGFMRRECCLCQEIKWQLCADCYFQNANNVRDGHVLPAELNALYVVAHNAQNIMSFAEYAVAFFVLLLLQRHILFVGIFQLCGKYSQDFGSKCTGCCGKRTQVVPCSVAESLVCTQCCPIIIECYQGCIRFTCSECPNCSECTKSFCQDAYFTSASLTLAKAIVPHVLDARK